MSTQPQFVRGDEAIDALHTGQEQKIKKSNGVPRFFIHRVVREDGSLQEQECVEITIPGDLKSVPINKVTQREIHRFPSEYEAFKKGEGAEIGGTSFELFLGAGDPRIPELRYHKIMNVEALAELTDTHIQNLGMGYMSLRDKARAYVKQRSGNESLAAQNKQLKEQLDALSAQVKGMAGDGGSAIIDKTPVNYTGHADLSVVSEKYTVKRGFQGKYAVLDGDTVMFEATGQGAKVKCEEWVNENK